MRERSRSRRSSAVDDLALALILTTVSPEVGGVLVRGEKGTAKTTMVRALAARAARPSRWSRAAASAATRTDPDPHCPDGPHPPGQATTRPARLVELPVGAIRGPGDRLPRPAAGARLGSGRTTSPACWPPRTAASSTSTRSTCSMIIWSTCCWTPPPWAAPRSSARASRSPRLPDGADRHHEPRGGRAPPAAARPVRADGGDRRPARPGAAGRGGPAPDGLRRRPGPVRRRPTPTPRQALRRADRRPPARCCRRCG